MHNRSHLLVSSTHTTRPSEANVEAQNLFQLPRKWTSVGASELLLQNQLAHEQQQKRNPAANLNIFFQLLYLRPIYRFDSGSRSDEERSGPSVHRQSRPACTILPGLINIITSQGGQSQVCHSKQIKTDFQLTLRVQSLR